MSFGYQPPSPDKVKPTVGKPPAGRYVVKLVGTESKPSASMMPDNVTPKCTRVGFQFEVQGVLQPDYKGKFIWVNINEGHLESEQSNQIWHERMGALCYAFGKSNGWTHLKEVTNIPFLLDVYIKKQGDREQYEIGGIHLHVTAPQAPLPPKQAPAVQPPPAHTAPQVPAPSVTAPQAWQPPGQDSIPY